MSPPTLTRGSIYQIHTGGELPVQPIVQLLSHKIAVVGTNGLPDRHRLIFSDGQYFTQSMLSTSFNYMMEEGILDRHCFFKLDEYVVNPLQSRKVVIILACTPLEHYEERIGNPTSIDSLPPGLPPLPASTWDNGGMATDSDIKPLLDAAPKRAESKVDTKPPVGNNLYKAKAKDSKPLENAAIYPIASLSPYQNKWTIKARVTNKSDIRHWSNAKGEGKLFSVTFMDESGEIRATGFNDVVDKIYPLLEEGKVFFLTKARVNIAKKQFNNVNNEYELMLGNDSEVVPCTDAEDVPQVKYNFVPLSDLENVEKDAMCDVIGVVKDVGELGSITSKATQRSVSKRELVLVDQSMASVRLTLWGKQAEQWSAMDNPVVAFKGVKVGDFGGRSLSMVSSSAMLAEPDIEAAHELRGWYDSSGAEGNFTSYTSNNAGSGSTYKANEYKTIEQVKAEGLGQTDVPAYFNTRARVIFIQHSSFAYPACPTDRCNKKLVMEGNDVWRCEKCERTYSAPEYRYILSVAVSDHTGQAWFSGFNDAGQIIVGMDAGQLQAIKEANPNDDDAIKTELNKVAGYQYEFSCRAKSDHYNDQMKVRYQIMACKPVNFVEAGKRLVEQIQAYGYGF